MREIALGGGTERLTRVVEAVEEEARGRPLYSHADDQSARLGFAAGDVSMRGGGRAKGENFGDSPDPGGKRWWIGVEPAALEVLEALRYVGLGILKLA
jgi:hypothetical protein